MSRKSGFFAGLVWGSLVGAAVALLYAPKAGKELREDLTERAHEYKDLAGERFVEYRDLALERAGEYRDFAVEKGVNFYDAANSKTEEIRVSLAKSAQELKDQLVHATFPSKQEEVAEDAETVITEFKEALEQQANQAEEA